MDAETLRPWRLAMPKRRFRHADPAAAVQGFLRYLEMERAGVQTRVGAGG
jgi:hypothetical protein